MSKMKIKKGDQVKVVTGKEAGKTGKVMRVDTEASPRGARAPQHDEEAHQAEPEEEPAGRRHRARGVNRRVQRDARVPGLRPADASGHTGSSTDGSKVRKCRRANCGKDIDKA